MAEARVVGDRVRLLIALLVVTPLGFASKAYGGPGASWLGPYGAGALYVVFWILLVALARPAVRAWPLAAAVCVATFAVELLQLVSTPVLDWVRASFLGRTLLGSTFSWWDFPPYVIGAAAGGWLLTRLVLRASGSESVVHRGGCHCGAVRFEVDAPAEIEGVECNCSICRLTGFQHLIVPQTAFRLTEGADRLTSYRFNTRVADHRFCAVCGIEAFYVPRSHPDGYSVNVRCLDPTTIEGLRLVPFDGASWEEHVAELRGLS